MRKGNKSLAQNHGFTLVELLVVLSILALLLSLATPRYFKNMERAKEATLKQDLNTMRDGIDKFYADNGKYPNDLEELVDCHYFNKLPVDSITDSTATWVLIAPEPPLDGNVFDVQSVATGATGAAKDGTNYTNL